MAHQSGALLDDVDQFDIVDHEASCDASLSFSLSFRDIAVVVGASGSRKSSAHHRALSSPSHSSFEFFSSAGEMCLAEDVFLGGKLLPLMPRSLFPRRLPSDHRQRFESQTMGKHRRLRRAASVTDRKDLRPPAAAAEKLQPKWYFFVLGPMRIPAEMEMENIRSRQRKRTIPSAAAHGVAGPSNRRSGTWRFLRSLSCNGMDIAPVEPRPVRFTSHVAV